MQQFATLRIGLWIQHQSLLMLVKAMLSLDGNQTISLVQGAGSLANALEQVISHSQREQSPPFDVLILEDTDGTMFADPAVVGSLEHVQALGLIPIMILSGADDDGLDLLHQRFPGIVFLSSSPLTMLDFFGAIGRLTEVYSSAPARLAQRIQQVREEQQTQLVQQEQIRIATRYRWLDQRQEWLDQRKTWLDGRQSWIDERIREPNPQYEWLAEHQGWLAQQQDEVAHQHQEVNDLRRWLCRYQRNVDDERPPIQ